MPAGFSISNLSVNNDSTIFPYAIDFYHNNGLIQLVDVNATSGGEDGIGILGIQS